MTQIKKFDKLSGANREIEAEHSKIHDGLAFALSNINSLTAGSTAYYAFVGVTGYVPHWRLIRLNSTGAPFVISLYENPYLNVNSLGTQLTPYNMNRNSSIVSSLTAYLNPVINVNSLGTQLEAEKTASTAVQGGSLSNPTIFEWIFNNGVNYVLAVKNEDSTTESYGTTFFWYSSVERINSL